VYSCDASLNGTLLFGTADTTTLFAAINTAYTTALTGTVSLTAGTTYAFAWLMVATTMPTLPGANPFAGQLAGELGQAPRLTGLTGSALTALPASFTGASLTNVAGILCGVLVP